MGHLRDARREVARSWAVARAITLTVLLACGADDAHPDALGVIALPVAIVTDDAAYRLRGTFAVRDARADAGAVRRVRSEDNPDASALALRLEPGDYAVLLEPGWTLTRRTADGETTAPAELVSDNPVVVRVTAGARASASFRLHVDGEVRTMEEGTLEIDVDVDERAPAVCGNQMVEQGEVCDSGTRNGLMYECDATCLFRCEDACPVRLDPGAAADGDGRTWATPARDLQRVLQRFGRNEVWIRGGVDATDLSQEIVLGNATLILRGGFDGTERTPEERLPGTARTRVPGIRASDCGTLELDRVELGALPVSEAGLGRAGDLSVRGCGSLRVRDSAVYNAHMRLEATRARFDRVEVQPSWATTVEVESAYLAWAGGTLGFARNYAALVANESRVLLQDLTVDARVDILGSSEALIVGSHFAGGPTGNGAGTLTVTRATVVDSTFADIQSGGRAPVKAGALFVWNTSFVNVRSSDLRGSVPVASVIEGEEVEIVASTFYQNSCFGRTCYVDVRGATRVIGSLFVEEDPEESSNQMPSPASRNVVAPESALSGSCATYAVSAFALGPPPARQVLALAHPCLDGASATTLESARKRLVALTAPFRTRFFDADVGRYDNPDWWKRRSVRAGRCTDDGAPDPGRHYDLPCPAR
ncbi:MAG: hypothetical protein ABW252_05400 [Polyangiales bacterium]